MTTDPNVKAEEVKEVAAGEAQESAAQDKVMEATQDSEDGGVQG